MTADSFTVSEILTRARDSLVSAFPAPVWVVGEITGFKRTSGGAAFFRLADSEDPSSSLEVAARGMIMADVDRALGLTGVGSLRDGIGIRANGTLGLDSRGSRIRLALLEIDPEFTVGRLALERARIIERLTADGSLRRNSELPMPLVPLRVGLVTSRGSAAHADFLHQLERSGFRFRVRLRHTTVQGEGATQAIAESIAAFEKTDIDVLVVVRGGGSRLDLAAFDDEGVARAIASARVPVLTGIGHETDRSVADEAAHRSEKTPSAAAEWLVGRVSDFAARLDRARYSIGRESRSALGRHEAALKHLAASLSASSQILSRESQRLDHQRSALAVAARRAVERHRDDLSGVARWIDAFDVDNTLRRGFAIVTSDDDGRVVRSSGSLSAGDRLSIRLPDGTVPVEVIEP